MTITEPRAVGGGMDADQVFVPGMQRVWIGAVGTDFPDGIDEDPDPGDWTDLGFTTEDGITISVGKDTDDLMTSQSLQPVRILVTGQPITVAFSLRQISATSLVAAMGGGTINGDDDAWHFTPAPSSFIDERALIVQGEDGANKLRWLFYRASLSEAVEIPVVNTDSIVLPLTYSLMAHEPPYEIDGSSTSFLDTQTPLGTVGVTADPVAGQDRTVRASVTGTPTP